VSVLRAFKLVFSSKALIVNIINDEDNHNSKDYNFQTYNWDEWLKIPINSRDITISSVNFDVKVPEVIVLARYDEFHKRGIRLTKRNIFIRDQYRCQYSGKQMTKSELDIDHVLPVSRGGKNEWENMVVCSKKINRKKGSKTPKEAGLNLIKKPSKPIYEKVFIDPLEKKPKSWDYFIKENY